MPQDKEDLFHKLCSMKNLYSAFKKAKKGKGKKQDIIDFEKNLKKNLETLRIELLLKSYFPRPLCNFVIRDPKTRKVSKSEFRDRVIHHALCNIICPILEKNFIYDSYANRKGKGTIKAVERFEYFKKKVSRNNTIKCFILKCDIKKYFENINHNILFGIIKKKIKDQNILRLIEIIITGREREREKYWNASW